MEGSLLLWFPRYVEWPRGSNANDQIPHTLLLGVLQPPHQQATPMPPGPRVLSLLSSQGTPVAALQCPFLRPQRWARSSLCADSLTAAVTHLRRRGEPGGRACLLLVSERPGSRPSCAARTCSSAPPGRAACPPLGHARRRPLCADPPVA